MLFYPKFSGNLTFFDGWLPELLQNLSHTYYKKIFISEIARRSPQHSSGADYRWNFLRWDIFREFPIKTHLFPWISDYRPFIVSSDADENLFIGRSTFGTRVIKCIIQLKTISRYYTSEIFYTTQYMNHYYY